MDFSARRYERMAYRRCGRSGLLLPAVSLGLWHNFGGADDQAGMRSMVCGAFDLGITHFDLANNYGPPPGSAEENFGRILASDLACHRDELVISTKAGYQMWPGPYGAWGSRKHMLASLDQSLRRLRMDHVDIFYSHRYDPSTPLEETLSAMETAVRQGKAIYVGISNYRVEECREASRILGGMNIPLLIQQSRYSLFKREIEPRLLPLLNELGAGCVAFSPLAQGLLGGRYREGIPEDSRAGRDGRFLKAEHITDEVRSRVQRLAALANQRGQTPAQMALSWVLRRPEVCSVLVGASRMEQIRENVACIDMLDFSTADLAEIDAILSS